MTKFNICIPALNYLDSVHADTELDAKIQVLTDLGLPTVEQLFDEIVVGTTKIDDEHHCDFNLYKTWTQRSEPSYLLIFCHMYKTHYLRAVKFHRRDYNLVSGFNWYIAPNGKIVTIVNDNGTHHVIDLKTVLRSLRKMNSMYEAMSTTIYLGEWTTWDEGQKRHDIALVHRYRESVRKAWLHFPQRLPEYLNLLQKNPNYVHEIQLLTYLKKHGKI